MGANSQLDGCGQFIKYTLFFFNFVVFVLGLVICGLGIWAVVDSSEVQKIIDQNLYIPAAAILIAFGGIVAFVSFLGCCGAIKEVKCLLGLFFFIMLLLTIVIVIGAIFAFVVKGNINDELQKAMLKTMRMYGRESAENQAVTKAWDGIQMQLDCCGTNKYTDWHNALPGTFPFVYSVPESCCKFGQAVCSSEASINTEGCLNLVKGLIEKHAKSLAYMGIAIAVIIVLSMIFSCSLCLMV